MPATPSRIGFIQREYRKVVASDSGVRSTYGTMARDSEDPVEAFFSDPADAEGVVDDRLALLGTTRRRFTVEIADGLDFLDMAVAGELPSVRYVDAEKGIDRVMCITAVAVDLGRGSANLTLWG